MRRREAPSPQASERRGMAVIPASWQAWSEQRLNACRGQGRKREMDRIFTAFAHRIASWSGQPAAFILAVMVILGWVVTGPIFPYFDTWPLIIHTGTKLLTLLMVFLIPSVKKPES